jgi:sugar lactone lactonase YvrE
MKWELIVDGLSRPEAPCPDGRGGLWFSDIAGEGAILHIRDDGAVRTIATRAHVGGIVPHVDGGIVASGHDVAVLDQVGEVVRTVLDADGGWGFNDITTDPAGNVFAGKHTERPSAALPTIEPTLWRISVDDGAVKCYGGLTMNNGLRVSPDGTRLYHADTLRRVVWVSDLDGEGLPHNRRVHHELRVGMPDGMAIDEHECLWIAAITAGVVLRIAPDGTEEQSIELPRSHPSAVCFVGADLRDVIVTAFGGEPYDARHAGCVLVGRADVAGFPLTPARV